MGLKRVFVRWSKQSKSFLVLIIRPSRFLNKSKIAPLTWSKNLEAATFVGGEKLKDEVGEQGMA